MIAREFVARRTGKLTDDRDKFSHHNAGLVLALSGGGAAGIAHIGVLQVLEENAIPVRAVAGTSIGAEIGAFFASGMAITELADLATAFDWKQTLQLFMPDLPTGGLVSGRKIMDFLNSRLGTHRIEELAIGYAAVAADLETGEQVVLDRDGLVDGGVLNPVPFDVARERFGGPVLAVAVHGAAREVARRKLPPRSRQWPQHVRQLLRQPWMMRAKGLESWLEVQLEKYQKRSGAKSAWTARRVLDQVMILTQAEMVRLRATTHPPDLMLLPAVGSIGRLEFYRGREAIAAGRAAAREKLAEIRDLLATEKNPQDVPRDPAG